MNSSFALEPISQDNALVTIALALAALLAIITVIAMIWGARLKRRRDEARDKEEERIEDLKASGVQATNLAESKAPAERTVVPPPVAPAPPPLSEAPALGMPPLADEPIAAAAPLDASPAALAADAPVGSEDDAGATAVTVLKGLGPKLAGRLAELGITRVDQLAWLDDAEAAALDAQLGSFQGRMEKDRWREQARLLARGDRAGYEAQFGRLG